MTAIFSFFGSLLGYLLWFLYTIFKNYGAAIILFTIILKIVMFPMNIKQQRSMASQAKLGEKQKELQKKYGNNRQKYNEEVQKLYEKEGVNPSSGCVTTLIPLPIMLGIYYSVVMPLSNTLHIAKDTINLATDYISRLPGVVSASGFTAELEIIRNFEALKENLTMFTPADLEKIEFFSKGFHFMGLDLLTAPQKGGFASLLWIIPLLSLVSSFGLQLYMMWYQKKTTGQKSQGCMMVTMFMFPLISVYWAWIMPAAVGLYWVVSSVASFLQSWVTNQFFSVNHMTAMAEAQRVVTLELEEASVRPLPAEMQKEIADKLNTAPVQQKTGKEAGKQKQGQSQKKKKGGSGDSSAYIGTKK